MKDDPKLYRELSVPFATIEASNEALSAFFGDVEAARVKHRIPDVVVLCEIAAIVQGEEVRGSASSMMGDGSRVMTILAREYGAEQARCEERLALIVARARKGARR